MKKNQIFLGIIFVTAVAGSYLLFSFRERAGGATLDVSGLVTYKTDPGRAEANQHELKVKSPIERGALVKVFDATYMAVQLTNIGDATVLFEITPNSLLKFTASKRKNEIELNSILKEGRARVVIKQAPNSGIFYMLTPTARVRIPRDTFLDIYSLTGLTYFAVFEGEAVAEPLIPGLEELPVAVKLRSRSIKLLEEKLAREEARVFGGDILEVPFARKKEVLGWMPEWERTLNEPTVKKLRGLATAPEPDIAAAVDVIDANMSSLLQEVNDSIENMKAKTEQKKVFKISKIKRNIRERTLVEFRRLKPLTPEQLADQENLTQNLVEIQASYTRLEEIRKFNASQIRTLIKPDGRVFKGFIGIHDEYYEVDTGAQKIIVGRSDGDRYL